MKKFKVVRSFVSFGYVVVDADNEQEASEKAEEIDGGEFITIDEEFDSEITRVEQI